MQVLTRTCAGRTCHSDVTISWDGKQGYKVRVSSRTGSVWRMLGISKKVSRVEARHQTRWLAFGLVEARRICALWAPHGWGGRWKSQNWKIVPLSLCRRTFKLKGNKRFVLELRSCYVFFEFRDSYVLCEMCYIYM